MAFHINGTRSVANEALYCININLIEAQTERVFEAATQ